MGLLTDCEVSRVIELVQSALDTKAKRSAVTKKAFYNHKNFKENINSQGNTLEAVDNLILDTLSPRKVFQDGTLPFQKLVNVLKPNLRQEKFSELNALAIKAKQNFDEITLRRKEQYDISDKNETKEKLCIFYSYAHEDESYRDELKNHLTSLRNQHIISEWHDREMTAGTEWQGEIDKNLKAADIILLLISSDFMASDYINDVELKIAMKRHESGQARVIPIILRPVNWDGALFSKLQALPTNALPVTKWKNIDEAFTDVATGIQEVVEELKA